MWVAVGLYLVFLGLLLLTLAVSFLIKAIHDAMDAVSDNIVTDERGWPVIAVAKPDWGEDGHEDATR
jgi:hypothetical protein